MDRQIIVTEIVREAYDLDRELRTRADSIVIDGAGTHQPEAVIIDNLKTFNNGLSSDDRRFHTNIQELNRLQ